MQNKPPVTVAAIQNVKIQSGLMGHIAELVKDVVIPYQWEILNDRAGHDDVNHGIENQSDSDKQKKTYPSHCIANFRIAAGEEEGDFYGMVFQDSDLAKWIEAASYKLAAEPNPALEATLDETIALIGRAQQKDGYLNTYFTIKEPQNRFTNLCECHELYCAGHMIEAAVAYYEATGKKSLIDIMCRMVDCISRAIGPEAGKLHGYPGHEEIELALVKLYTVTGNKQHLQLAKYFIDERGKKPLFFDAEFETRNHRSHFAYFYPPYGMYSCGQKYEQYHLPIREQKEFVGHAVRCMYMASGAADVARYTDDQELYEAIKGLYCNLVEKRLYVTGAIGSTPTFEMFTADYDLPNDMVYGETCASIGLVFFMQRMLLQEQNAAYADTMERALFNACIAGMALDGKRFFYVNPLEVDPVLSQNNPDKKHVLPVRPAWFGCACCPPNLARLITSLAKYLYTVRGDRVYVNLYMGASSKLSLCGKEIAFDTVTEYPYEGTIRFQMHTAGKYAMCLRIPAWSKFAWAIQVNGKPVPCVMEDGYAVIDRDWTANDQLTLSLDMTPRRVYANPKVTADVGKVAIQRGPLLFCLEEADNVHGLQQVYLPKGAPLKAERVPCELGDVVKIYADGLQLVDEGQETLYTTEPKRRFVPTPLTFIPYYTWANRGENQMTVWVREQ